MRMRSAIAPRRSAFTIRPGVALGLAVAVAACAAPRAGPAAPAPGEAAGGAGATQPAAPPAREIRVSYPSAAATFAPLWAAHELGLFEQNGIRAEQPQMLDGGPANAQALVAREVSAAYTAFSPMVAAMSSGAPIKAVAGFGRGFVHHLFTKQGTGVTRAQDMKGKRAGVSRIGTESHTVIALWARANGLQDDDITYVNAGTVAERLAGLEGGIVDLVPLDPPVVVIAEKRGYVRVVDLSKEPVPWQRESLIVPEDMLRDDPALAAAILRAVSEAAYLIRAERPHFDTVVSKYIRLDDPDALDAAYAASVRGWNARGRPAEADVRAVQEVVEQTNPGTAREPYSRFVDLSALDLLEREGFFDRLEQRYPLPAAP